MVWGLLGLALATPSIAAIEPATASKIDALSVPFVANLGQWDSRAAYAAPTFAGTLFVTTTGQLVYRMRGGSAATAPTSGTPTSIGETQSNALLRREPTAAAAPRRPDWALTEWFVDADLAPIAATPRASDRQPGRVSYLAGVPGHEALPTYGQIQLGRVFPGVEVALRATGRNVEKIFTVAPGSDPARIRVRIGGASAVAISDDGTLVATTGNGPVTYTAPIAFQPLADGTRRAVPVAYALDADTFTYAFALGTYDRDLPLVIDPLLQSTYVGGNLSDSVNAIAIHPATGEVYVAGSGNSTVFPGTTGGAYPTNNTVNDGFVVRFSADLATRLQSTFLGGGGAADTVAGLAIHPLNGDVYVVGSTNSTDFPGVTIDSAQAVKGAGTDAYIARLNPALTAAVLSTYLGGGGDDSAGAIVIHPIDGDIFIAGNTTSADLPGRVGGYQDTYKNGGDGFVSRFSADLKTRRQSTYVGGTAVEQVTSIAANLTSGDIVVAGVTTSTDLPFTTGGAQAAPSTGAEAFVIRLNHRLTASAQSTYLGGTGSDVATAVVALPNGNVVVGLASDSPSIVGVPGTSGGLIDIAIVQLNAQLTQIVNAARIAGVDDDTAPKIALHPASGEIYVAGTTKSTGFPLLAGAAVTNFGGGTEAFVAHYNASLALQQSTYLGGVANEDLTGIAIHPLTGDIYIAGQTTSTDLAGRLGGAQPDRTGAQDGFISRFTYDLRNLAVAQPAAFSFAPIYGAAPGSLQVSAPATITGLGISPQQIAILGGNLAQFCISSTASCNTCDVRAFDTAAAAIANNQSVCVRQYASPLSPGGATTTVLVGGGSAKFFVGTGTSGGCALDVDGNNTVDPLTDGLLLMRAMLGMTGTAVTDNAVGASPARQDWTAIRSYLNGNCGTSFAQ
jgi:hypothetical protein